MSYGPPPTPPPRQQDGSHLQGQEETYAQPAWPGAPRVELSNPTQVQLGGLLPIYFEHHIVLYKSPSVSIKFASFSGVFRRFFAGLPIFQTEARGPGNIAFSRDSVGQIVALHLQPGQSVEVREHQFLLATLNCGYQVTRFQGVANILFSRTGLLIDVFTADINGPREEILHGYGNVMERVLQPGEALDVEPGAWLWKDPSVTMQTINVLQSQGSQPGQKQGFLAKLESGLGNFVSGGGSLFMNRLVGPGRIGLQSMTYHPPTAEGAPEAGGRNNF